MTDERYKRFLASLTHKTFTALDDTVEREGYSRTATIKRAIRVCAALAILKEVGLEPRVLDSKRNTVKPLKSGTAPEPSHAEEAMLIHLQLPLQTYGQLFATARAQEHTIGETLNWVIQRYDELTRAMYTPGCLLILTPATDRLPRPTFT